MAAKIEVFAHYPETFDDAGKKQTIWCPIETDEIELQEALDESGFAQILAEKMGSDVRVEVVPIAC
jgi:hypothetical protein